MEAVAIIVTILAIIYWVSKYLSRQGELLKKEDKLEIIQRTPNYLFIDKIEFYLSMCSLLKKCSENIGTLKLNKTELQALILFTRVNKDAAYNNILQHKIYVDPRIEGMKFDIDKVKYCSEGELLIIFNEARKHHL